MPVQFVCSNCRRTLRVAQRKAGATVACPKCGQPTLVPPLAAAPPAPPERATPEPASEATHEPESGATSEAIAPTLPEAGAFDDVVGLITQTQSAADPAAPVAPAVAAIAASVAAPPPLPGKSLGDENIAAFPGPPVASRAVAPPRARRQEGVVLLVSRQAVYAQVGLVAGLVLLAFIAGWLIGRGNRPAAKPSAITAAEPVALEGHVLYSLSPGASLPDSGATIIALPEGKRPDRKIAASGSHSDEGDPGATPLADALQTIGAAITRSDSDGQFQLVVLRPGDYSLLIISRRADRPDDQAIDPADREELSRYFASPEALIGTKRYALFARRLTGAPPPFMHEFRPLDRRSAK